MCGVLRSAPSFLKVLDRWFLHILVSKHDSDILSEVVFVSKVPRVDDQNRD